MSEQLEIVTPLSNVRAGRLREVAISARALPGVVGVASLLFTGCSSRTSFADEKTVDMPTSAGKSDGKDSGLGVGNRAEGGVTSSSLAPASEGDARVESDAAGAPTGQPDTDAGNLHDADAGNNPVGDSGGALSSDSGQEEGAGDSGLGADVEDASVGRTDGGDGGPMDSDCVSDLDIAPTRERFTAYVTSNDYGQTTLWATRSNAPNEAILIHESEYSLTSLQWSPDGRWLAFVQNGGPWASSLGAVDFGSGEPSNVMMVDESAGYEVVGTPRWSPHSSRLAYAESYGSAQLRLSDVSSGVPSAPIAFGMNCPQGAFQEFPCLGAYLQPISMDWAPGGEHLAITVTSQFFTEFATGSAADLFLLQPDAPESVGNLASPFVPSFDPARRGVAEQTFAWSPAGTSVTFSGSFEDGGSVAEAYTFEVSGESATPIKLHPDIEAPHEGVRSPLVWASETTIVFEADINVPSAHELFALDVSDPSMPDFPDPQTLLSASDGSILMFGLSPDRTSVFVVREAVDGDDGLLSVYSYRDAPLTGPRELSTKVERVNGGFRESAQWSADSGLLAFVEREEEQHTLTVVGLPTEGTSCVTSSVDVDTLSQGWHWLKDEASVVFLNAQGVQRLHANGVVVERLSAEPETGQSVVEWAVQPRSGVQ